MLIPWVLTWGPYRKVVTHKHFDKFTYEYDIALLEMHDAPIQFQVRTDFSRDTVPLMVTYLNSWIQMKAVNEPSIIRIIGLNYQPWYNHTAWQ